MDKEQKLNIAGIVLIFAFILSSLLIFAIKFWYVLIIIAVEIIIYRIVFRNATIPAWIYPIACGLSIAIMIIMVHYPTKICDGVLQHISNPQFSNPYSNWLEGKSEIEILYEYRTYMGIIFTVSIVFYIIAGIILIVKSVNYDDVCMAFYLTLPLSCLLGAILFNFQWYFSFLIIFSCLCPCTISFIEMFIHAINSDDSDDSGSSSSSSYDIFIIKH